MPAYDWEAEKAAYAAAHPPAAGAKANGASSGPREPLPAGDGPPPLPGNNPEYVTAGVHDELTKLAEALPGERNQALYRAGVALGRLAAVDKRWLRQRLTEACKINGLLDDPDDGIESVNKTIASAYRAAKKAGDREVPDGPEYFATVTYVSPEALRPSSNGSGPPGPPSPPAAVGGSSSGGGRPPDPKRKLAKIQAAIEAAEQDFWARPSLQRIYQAGLVQMVPPWALLGQCAARAIVMIPSPVMLPGVIGGVQGGSLNWFAALVAGSGQGKSTAGDLAEELVPSRTDAFGDLEPVERNVGSGEGIVQAFVKTPRRGGRTPAPAVYRPAVLFAADEVDSLTANAARLGSTTLPILRQAFTGGTLGFAYAKSTNDNHLRKHTYRLVFVLSGQPIKFAALLADHVGGTPQRFMWFPAFDLRIRKTTRAQRAVPIASLALPPMGNWAGSTKIEIPAVAEDLIVETRERSAHGEADELGSHEVFVREKFAAGLAVLDGRTDVDDEDWRLSGIAATVSRLVRDWVIEQIAGADVDEAKREGKRRGVVIDASSQEKDRLIGERKQAAVDKVAAWIGAKLAGGSMAEADLIQLQRSDKRDLTRKVLTALIDAGEVESRDVKGVLKVRLSKLASWAGPAGPGPAGP